MFQAAGDAIAGQGRAERKQRAGRDRILPKTGEGVERRRNRQPKPIESRAGDDANDDRIGQNPLQNTRQPRADRDALAAPVFQRDGGDRERAQRMERQQYKKWNRTFLPKSEQRQRQAKQNRVAVTEGKSGDDLCLEIPLELQNG